MLGYEFCIWSFSERIFAPNGGSCSHNTKNKLNVHTDGSQESKPRDHQRRFGRDLGTGNESKPREKARKGINRKIKLEIKNEVRTVIGTLTQLFCATEERLCFRGPKGDKGDQGTRGIPGIRGERGLAGPSGTKGQKGKVPLSREVCNCNSDIKQSPSRATMTHPTGVHPMTHPAGVYSVTHFTGVYPSFPKYRAKGCIVSATAGVTTEWVARQSPSR